jgi:superoxide dismutase, Cu-Zn family
MRGEIGAAALAALLLAGCQLFAKAPEHATAALQPTRGSKVTGEVTFQQVGDRVRMVAIVAGLPPNSVHGFHIHEVGDCSAPDASSAKSHFNPYGKPHGRGRERHAGDLPALKADARGRATLTVDLDIVTLSRGPADIVGRSVVVHAKPDDYATQPTGNTGARLACGVIRAD